MFGALVLAVSLVPYFFSTDVCWGWEIQDSFSMSRVYTGMSGSIGAAIHLSLSVCPSPWLTWASSPYGRLRVARFLTWRFKPRRTCVPRGPGRRIFMTAPWKSQKINHGPKHSSRGAVPLETTFKKEFVIQLGAVTPIAASHCSTFWSHCTIPAQGTSSQ